MVALFAFVSSLVPAMIVHADEPYFPEKVFDEDDEERDHSKAREYTAYLRSMGEPSLWKLSRVDHTTTTYRLLWLPSFHPAMSVRITRSGDTAVLDVVKLEGKGGDDPGKVAVRKNAKLTEDQWTWLRVYLARCGFWKMPTRVKVPGLVVDGDTLLCEGINEENTFYHVVDRNDPGRAYEELCWYILSLSGIDVRKTWTGYHEEDVIDRVTDETTPR